MNWPDMKATIFMPRAFPLSLAGNTSVMMAAPFDMVNALPTACMNRKIISSSAPVLPVLGVR
jgi:hypothetical protein